MLVLTNSNPQPIAPNISTVMEAGFPSPGVDDLANLNVFSPSKRPKYCVPRNDAKARRGYWLYGPPLGG
jgi:hypothetical protein